MKIANIGLDPTIAIASTQQGQHSETAQTSTGTMGTPAQPQPQVQLLLDNQVKQLLAEVTNILRHQAANLAELSPEVAPTAEALLSGPLKGETLIPQGLAAMLTGQKIAVQNLLRFASILDDAAVVKQQFPDGLPEIWQKLTATFESQIAKLGANPDKTLLGLAGQLTATETPVNNAPALLEQLCRQVLNEWSGNKGLPQSQPKLPELFRQITDDFNQHVATFTGAAQEKNLLVTILRQACQQLLETYSPGGAPQGQQTMPGLPETATQGRPAIPGLPAILDDLIENFEVQIIKYNPAMEKSVLVAELQHICRQLTMGLPGGERKTLQMLFELLQDGTPAKLTQAAAQHNLPELKEAWALLRLASAKDWLGLPAEVLRKSGRNVQELAATVHRSGVEQTGEQVNRQNSVTMVVPMYFGEEAKPYPVYIHISQDQERSASAEGFIPETWLRLCFVTENIGVVNMVFHVYGSNQLNIKVLFSDSAVAADFSVHVPDIQAQLAESPFILNDISIVSERHEG